MNWGDFGGLRSASFSLDTRRPGDRFGFAIVRDGKGKASFETLLSRDLPPSSLDFHLRRFPGGAFYRDQWSGRWKELGGKGLWEAMVDVRLSVGSGVRVTMSQGLRRRAAGRTLHPLTAGRGESRLKIIWQGSKWSLSGTLRRRRESGTRDSSSVTKLGLSLTRSSGGHTLSALAELSAKGGQPPNSAASGSPPRAEAEDDPPVGFVVGLRLRGRCRGKNIRLGAHFFAPGPPGGTLYCYQAGVEQGRTRAIRGPGSSFWLVVDTPIPRTRALLRFGWALMRQGEGGWDGRLGVRWHGKGS